MQADSSSCHWNDQSGIYSPPILCQDVLHSLLVRCGICVLLKGPIAAPTALRFWMCILDLFWICWIADVCSSVACLESLLSGSTSASGFALNLKPLTTTGATGAGTSTAAITTTTTTR